MMPVVQVALDRKRAIERELSEIDLFLEAHKPAAKIEKIRGRPKRYAEIIERMLSEGPMTRRQIVLALEHQTGVPISGNWPEKYVGTIVWRFLKKKVLSTANGYVLLADTQVPI